MGSLLLRLRDPRGKPIQIAEWTAYGAMWGVPRGRIPRFPARAGASVVVRLPYDPAQTGVRPPTWYLTLLAPAELPAEIHGIVPDWDLDVPDPLRVLPVDARTGRAIEGAVWEPPPDRPDLDPVVADARCVLTIPKAVLAAAVRSAEPPFDALFAGWRVPNRGFEEGVPAVSLASLAELMQDGLLRVPVRVSDPPLARHAVRLLGSDGSPIRGARVLFAEQRHRSDTEGRISLPHAISNELTVFGADGGIWVARWLAEDATPGAFQQLPDQDVVLPARRRITLEFPARPDAEESVVILVPGRKVGDRFHSSRHSMERRLHATQQSLVLELAAGEPWRLWTQPEVELSGRSEDFPVAHFEVQPDDARITFDWPPTRVVSRSSR